jgi:RluA family pseudouridine synthase
MFGFDLLYENGPVLVVAKPSGLLTQAPPGIDSLELRVKQFLKMRDNKPGNVYLGVPHRLDRPASGALVLARHIRAARRLSAQFEGRIVEKMYWVLVEGELSEPEGSWRDHLRKIPGVARAELVEEGNPAGRPAVLHYRVLGRSAGRTWLEVRLETGRNHQIRIQAASRGHAVLGDQLYGASTSFGPSDVDPRERAIALHARSLRFRHPMTQEWVEMIAPLPETWSGLLPV